MSVAIVTGGRSGIGRATAIQLAREGYDIGLTWNDDDAGLLEAIAECRTHDVHVEARRMDLGVPAAHLPVQIRAIDKLIDAMGGVDVFVCDAAGSVESSTTATWFGMQRAAWWMIEHGRNGRIVAISSLPDAGFLSGDVEPGDGLYGFINAMAPKLSRYRITLNAVAPGRPVEVAAAIAWLASPKSDSVTGHSFVIDDEVLHRRARVNQLAS